MPTLTLLSTYIYSHITMKTTSVTYVNDPPPKNYIFLQLCFHPPVGSADIIELQSFLQPCGTMLR